MKFFSEADREKLDLLLSRYSLSDFAEIFRRAQASSFLIGKNDSGWRPRFSWFLFEGNLKDLLGGEFDDPVQ